MWGRLGPKQGRADPAFRLFFAQGEFAMARACETFVTQHRVSGSSRWQPWVATHGKETPQPPHACNQRCGSHWAPTGKAGTTSSHSLLELRPERVARRANVTQAAPEAGTSYKAATKAAWSRAWRRGTSQGRQQHIHLGIQVIDGHRLTLDDSMQLTGASTTTVRGERRRIGTLAPEVRAARRTGSAGCS